MSRPNAPDASAWCIHGAIHRAKPAARVLLHCHPPYATALATLKDPAMKPIDQNTARFFDLVSYDLGFGGIADDTEEGTRLAAALGDKRSEEHTSELQSLMRISYAVFCLKKKNREQPTTD